MMKAAADCTFPNTLQSMGSLCQVITIIVASWQGHLYHRDWLRKLQPTDLSSLAFGKMSLVVEMDDADCLVTIAGRKGVLWLLQSPESDKWLLAGERH